MMYGSSQAMLGSVPPPVLLQASQAGVPLSLVQPPKANLAAIATFVRGEPTQGFPAKFKDTRLNKYIWTNSAHLFAHKPRYKFVSWETHLGTPAQNDAWTRLMQGSGSQGSAPTPVIGDPSITIVRTAIVDNSVNLRTPMIGDPIGPIAAVPSQLAPVTQPDPASLAPDIAQEISQMTVQPSGSITSATAASSVIQNDLMSVAYTPEVGADPMDFIKKWSLPFGIGLAALVLLSLVRR